MTLPLPEWLPQWAQALVLIAGLLFVALWMVVPFAVIGVKGRLDALAVQIDDLQAELRVMAMSSTSAPAREEAEITSGEPLSEVLRAQDRDEAAMPGEGQGARPRTARLPDPEDPECDIPAYERRAVPPVTGDASPPGRPDDVPPPPPMTPPQQAARPPASAEAGRVRMPPRAPAPPAADADGADARVAMARKGFPRTMRWAERRQRSEPTLRWPPRP
ncbi:hypothetical protein CFR73_01850 [Novacetimonas maltaceti]|uniref:Uncharacterized protein n=1 Tax=Novacetimonas maltaceti TaxID=1203393 RepID=A0A2S3W226_9PROT|nr:hypothetical protein [Novacetimonas maltaceti]POF62954.1 hypothetical protein KMAL_14550 [Novacetimonas maltaceti]PYD61799.1 hypothetical protein CFR73_01850 [Novacetimonas maltaceti]